VALNEWSATMWINRPDTWTDTAEIDAPAHEPIATLCVTNLFLTKAFDYDRPSTGNP
jgi:hypothetical protein